MSDQIKEPHPHGGGENTTAKKHGTTSTTTSATTTTTTTATTTTTTGGDDVARYANNKKKRLCRYPGCTRVIKSQGHCQRHGAKAKRCKVDGCEKQAQGTHNGMCKRHWRAVHYPDQAAAKAALLKKKNQNQEPPPPQGESILNSPLLEERRNLLEQYELGMALHNHQMMIVRRAAAYTPNGIPYYMLQQHQQPPHHQQYQGQQHTHQLHLNPPSLPLLPHLTSPSLLHNLPSTCPTPINIGGPAEPSSATTQQNLISDDHARKRQKRDNETVEEDKLRRKKKDVFSYYRRMLFSYSNHKYNPPFLHDEKEFKKEEFPIRMTDDRVFDRFVEWVLSVKFDQFTKLPLDKTAHIDHMHGLPGYINHSRDGMFRCLCSGPTNTLIGILESVIAAHSNHSEGTADITAPYDIMNVNNKTFLADLIALLTETIPALKKDWKEAPTAKIVRDEECHHRERKLSNRDTRSHNKGLSESAVEYLEAWMMSAEMIAKPYPTKSDKLEMMNHTGLECTELDKWLKRYRAALKKAPPPVVVAAINGDSTTTTTTTTATNTTTNIAAIVTSPIRENQVIY